MKRGKHSDLTRRQFLATAAGVAGGAVSGLAFSTPPPCPPPLLSVTGGTSAASPCATGTGTLPSLTLTSAAASGTYGWTFGQVFRQGDVPSGQSIVVNGGTSQSIIRNRWSDGSVKFAVLSGVTAFSQNVPNVLALSTTPAALSSSNVAEPTTLNVSATFSGAVTGTYTLQSCLGVDLANWNRENPGRVRQIVGPVMSEFHYYRPTTDAHVALWFFVRRYANGATEVETVVENGWLNVPAPGERDYSIALKVGGTTVYSASLSHYSHTRWSRVDWIGTNPQVTPRHDSAYLRATRVVPNYGYTSPSSAALTGFASALNPVPFAPGDWSPVMGVTGYQAAIGILPLWESLYCTTADPGVYAATISNNRGSGRWPIHFRDETTGRVTNYLSYPNTTLSNTWGVQAAVASGGSNGVWDIPHHPSNGYLAYLTEGRWTQLESLQFSAAIAILDANPSTRQRGGVLACINAPLTTRGSAWAWRTMGQAAAISPTTFNGGAVPAADSAVTAAFVQSIHDTAQWHNQRYVLGTIDGGAFKNAIGWVGQYDQYTSANMPADQWWGASWMVVYQGMALGHAADLGIENLSNQADLVSVRNFVYQNVLLTMGDNSTWNFRHGGIYSRPYLANNSTPAAPVFMAIPQQFAAYISANNLATMPASSGEALFQHDQDVVTGPSDSSNTGWGYWGAAISIIAQAIDADVASAPAAYALVQAAPNYEPQAAGASNIPQFTFVPRNS
jgi:hypothetical protein